MGCPSTEIGMLVHYVGVYTYKDQCLLAVEKCGTNNVPSPSSILFPPLTLECLPSLHFAAHYLHSRSWKGLEQQLGETPVQPKAAEGRSGLPVEYDDEPKLQ